MKDREHEQPQPIRHDLNLATNKTCAAQYRTYEQEILDAKRPLVDLRTIPRERWPEFYGRDVVLPPTIQHYMDGREPVELTIDEVQGLELAVEKFYGIEEPF